MTAPIRPPILDPYRVILDEDFDGLDEFDEFEVGRALDGKTPRHNVFNLRKTHCPKGHPYDAENTLIYRRDGKSKRRCHACKMEMQRRRRQSGGK